MKRVFQGSTRAARVGSGAGAEGARRAGIAVGLGLLGALLAWGGNARAVETPPAFVEFVPSGLDRTLEEGSTRVVEVELNPASPRPVTVEYSTVDGSEDGAALHLGTARAGRDYVPVRGVLEFAPGETRRTILLTALANGVLDTVGNRGFSLVLTNPTPPYASRTPSLGFTVTDRELPTTRDPWFAAAVGGGPMVVLPDRRILVACRFPGLKPPGLYRLLPDGREDPGFRPVSFTNEAGEAEPPESLLTTPDGRILVSGFFAAVNGHPWPFLARLNQDGTLDDGFRPAATLGAGARLRVHAVLRSGHLVVGVFPGDAEQVVLADPGGHPVATFAPLRIGGQLQAVAEDAAGRLLLGGFFRSVGGVARENLARVFPDGTVDPGFRPALDSGVETLLVVGEGRILVHGDFQQLNGIPCDGFARLESSGRTDPAYVPPPDRLATVVADEAGGVIAFTKSRRIVRLDPGGRLARDFGELRRGYTKFYGSNVDPRLVLHGDGLLVGDPYMVRFQGVLGAPLGRFLLCPASEVPAADLLSIAPRAGALKERAGPAVFEVSRAGDTLSPAWVEYWTREGSARSGVDFAETRKTVEFAPLEVMKTVEVRFVDDGRVEGPESFEVRLSQFDPDGLERFVAAPAVQGIVDDEATLRVGTELIGGVPWLVVRVEGAAGDWWDLEFSGDLVRWQFWGSVEGTGRVEVPLSSRPGRQFVRARRLEE